MIITFKIGTKNTQVEHLGMGVLWARVSAEASDASARYGWLEASVGGRLHAEVQGRLHANASEGD